MKRYLGSTLALGFACHVAWGADPVVTTSAIANAEVLTVSVPATWTSALLRGADRAAFLARSDRLLVNGGYFNAAHEPDALVVSGGTVWGSLRQEAPYSGFVWADAAGTVHIERRSTPPAAPAWAIQSGPLLVEGGRSAINASLNAAPRSVLALKGGELLVVRTGAIGLKELADGLAAGGIDVAINLDGGPSADLRLRVGGVATDKPGKALTPYALGFAPPSMPGRSVVDAAGR